MVLIRILTVVLFKERKATLGLSIFPVIVFTGSMANPYGVSCLTTYLQYFDLKGVVIAQSV
jgi:hypothetical protein